MERELRLGFHYHTPALREEQQIRMPGYLGLFVDSLAARCKTIFCFQHTPLIAERPQMDYALRSSNVRLVDIGPHSSIPRRTVRAYENHKTFRGWHDSLDAMMLRAPTPLLPVVASRWRKPIVLLLVADAVVGIENLPQPRWRRKIIRMWARWNQHHQNQVARRSLTFVNSHLLYAQYLEKAPNLIQTQTTTLDEGDFFERPDTCLSEPFRLLYTGRITSIKGLFVIVGALGQLFSAGLDVRLDLVGMVQDGDKILNELADFAHSLGVGDRLRYHGYQPAGPDLLAFYRRADIYVTASKSSSEGFPRTIWEAMASSLPVVATEVGSIPAFIHDAAVLVPPDEVPALAEAIRRLLTSPALQQELIQKGMLLARANTLSKRAEEMVAEIQHWLKSGAATSANKF